MQGIITHKPDVIILDRHLGQLDGTEVLGKIRAYKNSADTPVLMLTGEVRKDEVMKAITLGASDYLAKPFMPQELLSKVQKLLDAPKKKDE
jgi:DNA-binding response OmpR family regulator